MISHSNQNNRRPRRHDLIFVSPVAWRSLLKTRDDLAGEPLVAEWVDRLVLVARRTLPGRGGRAAVGFTLPPFAGKPRFRFSSSLTISLDSARRSVGARPSVATIGGSTHRQR
jgi:hypothetical protein